MRFPVTVLGFTFLVIHIILEAADHSALGLPLGLVASHIFFVLVRNVNAIITGCQT